MAQELYDQRIHSIDDICWTLGVSRPTPYRVISVRKWRNGQEPDGTDFVCMVDLAQDVGIVRIEDGILPFDQFGVLQPRARSRIFPSGCLIACFR